jgi:pimeloyl-ACP methyl ester carboxylesterase
LQASDINLLGDILLMHKKTVVRLACLVLVSNLIVSCGGSGDPANPIKTISEGDLVASAAVGSPLKSEIAVQLQAVGLSTTDLKYETDCYKLTYKTPDLSNTLVNASGLVCLPRGKTGASPLLSYQHGTIFTQAETPSNQNSGYVVTAAGIASFGYITIFPDYLGYGVSSSMPHPYVHAKSLSSTVINMLRATKHFLALPSINKATNGQLFLAGYSEGGYATLAAQKTIELTLASEFTVTASEPGAGPYDVTGTVQAQSSSSTIFDPSAGAFLIKSYDTIYNKPSQIDRYFTPGPASRMGTLFSGALDASGIATALGGYDIRTNTLFNQAFLDSYNGAGEVAIKAFVAENNIYNWKPSAPTFLFHGEKDDVVPYANTTTALQAMRANGATAVSVHICDAGSLPTTHQNCGWPYVVDMMVTFAAMARGL